MRKFFYLGAALTLFGVGIAIYGVWAQNKQDAVDNVRLQETRDAEIYVTVVNEFNNAKSKSDYLAVEKSLLVLPKKYYEEFGPQIKLRIAVLNFSEAEDLLNRARALQAALTIPNSPEQIGYDQQGNPIYVMETKPTPIHPAAMELLNKAMSLYESSKLEIDRIPEVKNNDDYNFRLNYVKGEVYHRYMQIFATQESAAELFNQTVTYYKQALHYKPADTDTVINIELLIKDEQGMGGDAGQPQQQKSKLLNQAAGHGHSKGN